MASRLKGAVAAYQTSAFNNDESLKALLAVQPVAVLDALFEGNERERGAGTNVFDHLHDHRANPTNEISSVDLLTWCDRDRETRYAIAASFVTFARRSEETGPQVWSEQATALLVHAPDPRTVLAEFVQRFRPMSWSGSRAAIIEANARLLDSLPIEISTGLVLFVANAKGQLSTEISNARERETAEDRARDERFE